MHWLPLVAMVIASALPFPYSPVTRIVAATTETGGSHEDGGGGELPPSPLPAPAHNCSDGSASQGPYHAHAGPPEQLQGPRGPEGLRTGPGGPAGERSDSHGDAADALSPGETRGTSDFSCHGAGVSADAAVRRDYGQGDDGGRGPTREGRPRDSLDGDSPQPLQVPDSGLVSPATGPQRGPGPLSQWEETPVTTETGAGVQVIEGDGRGPGVDGGPEPGMDDIQEVDELFLDAHPRVLFSPSASPPEHPPLLLMLESGTLPEGEGYAGSGGEHPADDPADGEGASLGWGVAAHAAHRRTKRADLSDLRRGERSVCESESVWVTDKKTAVDNHGRTVTILPVIQTPTGPLKQYFYETRCRRGEQARGVSARGGGARGGGGGLEAGLGLGVAGSGCLGVDKKQWKSECKAKHSFVRALAKDASNRMGWRWIRIDSSCVCVLLARVTRQAGGKA